MTSRTKVHQLPYANTSTMSYDWKSLSDTPEGRALAEWNPQIDPSIQQRSDLAQQESENRWNNDFTSGLPTHVRMRLQGAENRAIAQGSNYERQQGEYLKNNLEFAKRQALLPRLVQTGGTSNGYNSQAVTTETIWGRLLSRAQQAAAGAAMASDERVKNIKGPAPAGLPEVLQLQPAQYQYKPEAGLDQGQEHQGLVAQNVEQPIPEAVGEDESGIKTVNYEAIAAALINAVKELKMEVDELKQGGASPPPAPSPQASPRPMRPMGGGASYA